jgi:hypothetical protein
LFLAVLEKRLVTRQQNGPGHDDRAAAPVRASKGAND